MTDLSSTSTQWAGSGRSFPGRKRWTPVGAPEKTSIFFTLRARLIALFIFMALVPLVVLGSVSAWRMQVMQKTAVNKSLLMTSRVTAAKVDAFLLENMYSVNNEAQLPELAALLSTHPKDRPGSQAENRAIELLHTLYTRQRLLNMYIMGYWLFDPNGKVVISTQANASDSHRQFLGLDKADTSAFNSLVKTGSSYVSPVLVSPDGRSASLYFAGRVIDANNKVAGILVTQYNADALQSIIESSNNLAGPASFSILLDDFGIRLAQGLEPDFLYQSVAPLGPGETSHLVEIGRLPSETGAELSTEMTGLADRLKEVTKEKPFFTAGMSVEKQQSYLGAVFALNNRSWLVATVQPESVVMVPLIHPLIWNILLTLSVAVLTLCLALFVTRRLTRPITQLIQAAGKVSAGNLWVQAPEGRDEIGTLARAFNSMTVELRTTLEGLEHRVDERTAALAKASEQMEARAKELQTVAEVAHAIASVQDPDSLLKQVTLLISERFAFYHVGIFLIDKSGEYAVLRAANSEGGQRMLARGHRLTVGETGIVGYVTGRGLPRVALDVGQDAVFFNNPDLPYTRSEVAVPLIVGDRLIGALDVQSMEQSAFDDSEVALLRTLADQVAIAIENTRLFSETRSALKELQDLHQQHVKEAWTTAAAEHSLPGYQYRDGEILPLSESSTAAWKLSSTGREEVRDPAQGGSNSVIVPISVRGQVIGMVDLGFPGSIERLSDEDAQFVRNIADQIGQALENARLIEETQRRAEREHLVAEITAKLRATNDPERIMQTAATELRQALRAKQVRFTVQPTIPTPEQKAAAPADGNGHQSSEDADV